MVIIMKLGATQHELDEVMRAVEASGFRPFLNPGVERKVVAVLGEVDIDKVQLMDQFSNMAGVYAELGEMEKANSYYREALRCDPDYTGALAVLATHLRDKLPEEDVEKMKAFLASARPAPACCGAARSSRGPRRTASRGSARTGCACLPRRAPRPACRS